MIRTPNGSLVGKRVKVYRNLNNGLWSVKHAEEPVVHVDTIHLSQVLFYVSATGQKRVRQKKQRAVHAWATGKVIEAVPNERPATEEVSYNPYRDDCFHTVARDAPTYTALFASFLTPPDRETPGCFVNNPNA